MAEDDGQAHGADADTAVAMRLNAATAPLPGCRYAFLLIPGFSQIAFAAAIEPLRMANMVLGRADFSAVTVTVDGGSVTASNGVRVTPDHGLADLSAVDCILICGPNPIWFPHERRLVHWLRRQAQRGVCLGGIDTGALLLARAGLLEGYRCTVHWQDLQRMRDAFPGIVVSPQVYEIDRDRLTCSGGTASMDLMLARIGAHEGGAGLAAAVADLLVHQRVRSEHDRQRMPIRQRLGTSSSALTAAVMLMEANIEEPLGVEELAGLAGISIRQLERLFRQHLGRTPGAYYMELRLERARELLCHTDRSIGEIATDCGFRSAAHLSRRYHACHGHPPRAERRPRGPESAVER